MKRVLCHVIRRGPGFFETVPRAANSFAQDLSEIYLTNPVPPQPRAGALCRAGTVHA
jgi:hypothetical protein